MTVIDYEGLKAKAYKRLERILDDLRVESREQAKADLVSSILTEEEFNNMWPEEQEVTLNRCGRFQYKGFWFELRSVYSQDTSYYENLAFEGFILFAKPKLYGDYGLCSGLIEPYNGMEHLNPTERWEGFVVPEVVLKIADEYIAKKLEEEED